jgi:hypothetical protein
MSSTSTKSEQHKGRLLSQQSVFAAAARFLLLLYVSVMKQSTNNLPGIIISSIII